MGTSLKELERMNGRPFLLAGFAWDYSGTVTSWKKGALTKNFETDGHVILRLDSPRSNAVAEAEYNEVLGDRDYPSNNSVMQKLNPRVYQVVWLFP